DILDGGIGNDYLDGGVGNDTYVFGKGYGQDIIDNSSSSGSDIDVLLMKNLSFNEVTLTISNTDLIIEVNGTKDSIKVARYFENGYFSLEKIKFSDNKELDVKGVQDVLENNKKQGIKAYASVNNYQVALEKSIETIGGISDSRMVNINQPSNMNNSSNDKYLFNLSNNY
ncbi:Haemolysin-type calcium binding protein related domain-containing protein, partial [Clostridium cavendishii DSM 21758]